MITDLLKYNVRVMLYRSSWLLAVIVSVTLLTIVWIVVTQLPTPALPAQVAELFFPLIGALMSAHLLSQEYRASVASLLASKPVDMARMVGLRLACVLGFVSALAFLSLLAMYFGMRPFPLLAPLAAGLVSTVFLSLLSLTLATLFRSAAAGFGIAALYWALDLPPGPPMNPLLSLKSLTSAVSLPGVPAADMWSDQWWIAKVTLLVLAGLLHLCHRRALVTLAVTGSKRRPPRRLVVATLLLAIYIASGATLKTAYGYYHRSRLFPDDATWFRKHFAPYGRLPVAALFGVPFQRYLGEIYGDEDLIGDTLAHRNDLRLVLEEAPNSLWAPSAAELLARLEERKEQTVEGKIRGYEVLLNRYGDSPYAPAARAHIRLVREKKLGIRKTPK